MALEASRARSYCRLPLLLSMVVAGCLVVRPAFPQTPTIEDLEKRIEEAKRAKDAAQQAEAESKRQRDQAAAAPGPLSKARRFDELGDGLLRDHRTGLVWSASDNGADINWDDAAHYCNRRGMLLPTVAQLQSLVDRSGTMTTPCQGKQCKVSQRFHLTGYRFWTQQQEDERWALFVSLNNGRRNFDHAGLRDNFRALCVRGT